SGYFALDHTVEVGQKPPPAPRRSVPKSIPEAKLLTPPAYPTANLDGLFLPLLQKRFRRDDADGARGRVQQLWEKCGKLAGSHARAVLARLEARQKGDKLAAAFHGHLATAVRRKLMQVLQAKSQSEGGGGTSR